MKVTGFGVNGRVQKIEVAGYRVIEGWGSGLRFFVSGGMMDRRKICYDVKCTDRRNKTYINNNNNEIAVTILFRKQTNFLSHKPYVFASILVHSISTLLICLLLRLLHDV